jgi:hypothetical protein
VDISGETFTFGDPRRILGRTFVSQLGNPRPYDVSPDGQRFLMIKDPAATDPNAVPERIEVVVNWQEELKQRVPTR